MVDRLKRRGAQVKNCNECDEGQVFLYVDGVTGNNAGWYCRECGKTFTNDEVKKLAGEIDPMSKKRMGDDRIVRHDTQPRGRAENKEEQR